MRTDAPAIAPDDVPAVRAGNLADAVPAIPLEPEPIAEKAVKTPAAAQPKEVPAAKAPQKPPQPSEPEFELAQEYELVLDAEPLVPAYDQRPPETPIAPSAPEPVAQNTAPAPPAGSGFASDQFLADLANEIDQLGIGGLSPGFSGPLSNTTPPPPPKPPPAPPH